MALLCKAASEQKTRVVEQRPLDGRDRSRDVFIVLRAAFLANTSYHLFGKTANKKKRAEITGYLAVVGIYHMTTMSMILLLAIQTLLHNILPYFLFFAVTAYIFITNQRLNMV